ncbi:ATP-dependent DNA helicase, RecQ family [Spirosoma fluviale]|uniref:DNA 3'-5' helicase n=2 Tax=Spirosoma fluviale TaxID=1597977 RepID=A0A286F694_9BACT|nr:ATP-dependent DNA helicase, RecQ family [Spirosoma fluviale]
MVLQASYLIDELLKPDANHEGFKRLIRERSVFSVEGIPEKGLSSLEPNPTFSILHNLISRGNPTRASQFLTGHMLSEFNISFERHIEKGDVRYKITEENLPEIFTGKDSLPTGSIWLWLVRVAQIQKVLLLLFANRITDVESDGLSILADELLKPYLQLAIEDIEQWYQCLILLQERNDAFPKISIDTLPQEGKTYDIAISLDEQDNSYSSIKINLGTKLQEGSPSMRFISASRIQYASLGEKKEGGFIPAPVREQALQYILQSVFRKQDFKPGQLSILNRALQGQDVVGLLPTGGGKSLTYQLSALLQPAVTIVVDPINSLMRDQYEKLLSNHIDACAYINTYNSTEERVNIEEQLSVGNLLIVFVSPERFQIKKFRNLLTRCRQNSVFFGYAVIDEAHCVSEWGHDFRQTYLRLAGNLRNFCRTKTGADATFIALTATASFDVLADIQRELNINTDAIQQLPSGAIDRKELEFNLIKIEPIGVAEAWVRDKIISAEKHPKLLQLLREVPLMKSIGKSDFYRRDVNGSFPNAGIIFCPTKSDTRGNGVLSVRDGFHGQNGLVSGTVSLSFLETVTFFSESDENLASNTHVETEAKSSFGNQTKFIENQANLMISTKAFGMGIDKSNVRFTIHYSLPSSVESFYQEAGRAGRDGEKAVCTILYCPSDVDSNIDFLKNSFKGVKRERTIFDEFITEIRYESKFFIQYLNSILKEEFGYLFSLSIWNKGQNRRLYVKTKGNWNKEKKLFVDSPEQVNFGFLNLDTLTENYSDIKNATEEECRKVMYTVKRFLRKFCPGGNYGDWLNQIKSEGLESSLAKGGSGVLILPFTNDLVKEISNKLKEAGNAEINERIVRSAYNFCDSEDKFIDDLKYEYQRATKFKEKLIIEDLESSLKESFWKIRSFSDTQRAVYRLSVLGIIEDYTIDYAGRAIIIYFKQKPETDYRASFEDYLKRYEGEERVRYWLNQVDEQQGETILRRYLYTLTRFAYETIEVKRRSAIDYMKKLCDLYFEIGDDGQIRGQAKFREDMVNYFISKYASQEYLPKHTQNGKLEDFQVVRQYINYVKRPGDVSELGVGGEIDNLKHIIGGCDRILTESPDSRTVRLIRTFAVFAIETYNQKINLNSIEMSQARGDYLSSFGYFLNNASTFKEWSDNLAYFNDSLLSINNQLSDILEDLTLELSLGYHLNWLTKFNESFIDTKTYA